MEIFANALNIEATMDASEVIELLEQLANKLTTVPNKLSRDSFDISALIKDIRTAEDQIDVVIKKLRSGDYNTEGR